jgi:hypothetical protein
MAATPADGVFGSDSHHHLHLVEADVPGIGPPPRRPVVAEDFRPPALDGTWPLRALSSGASRAAQRRPRPGGLRPGKMPSASSAASFMSMVRRSRDRRNSAWTQRVFDRPQWPGVMPA